MRVSEYVDSVLGQIVWSEAGYGAQCVGAYKHFCQTAGLGAYPTGNGWADGYWYQAAPAGCDRVGAPYRNGDWVVWPKGSRTAPSSHIAMYYNGKALSQNQNGHSEMTLVDVNWSDALGAIRWNGWESEEVATPVHAGTLECEVDCVNVRTAPSTDAEIRAQYHAGQTVNILDIVHENGYYWGHYVSYSGVNSYVALAEDGGRKYFENI